MADDTPLPVPPENASKTALNRFHHTNLAKYGNYHNYYFHREQVSPDARLALLPPEVLQDQRILDLGCNAGKLTIELIAFCGARSAQGVDLDPQLVEDASSAAREQSVAAATFLCHDFMLDSSAFFAQRRDCFDTVLLLSITKWLHLHHGDAGLKRLFDSIAACLGRHGVLVVEPQEWENYKRAVRKNRDLRETFRELKMRPPFVDELQSAGFSLVKTIEREEGGFSRPLMIWRKT